MTLRTIELNDNLYEYLIKNSLREPPVLASLRKETARMEMARMQIAPEQGQFMAFLFKLINARKYLEVGTFTGYSALVSALAMGPDSKIYTLDNNSEWTRIAQKFWRKAGVIDCIELIIDDAQQSLNSLLVKHQGSFDVVFIDADKANYLNYLELGYKLLRADGLLILDNTLWGGSVTDIKNNEPDTLAIRQVNRKLLKDQRFEISMIPIGDGLTLARKINYTG